VFGRYISDTGPLLGETELFHRWSEQISPLNKIHSLTWENVFFLNVLISQATYLTIKTGIYAKRTNNHQYFPYRSLHPKSSKDEISYSCTICTMDITPDLPFLKNHNSFTNERITFVAYTRATITECSWIQMITLLKK